ncbi:type II toxin-antitoxin system VapC family toxin [Aidingimonas lacisalsi]|uniref:type II toxin-antitoxin system VapC family toxin n=1 Tax=Aidingimonas lacisalsi TaxID=2604086 RepID=UPI0011D25AA1|nr:type II toxin-antitoxin system VapC family toxin [Aidingimonas lacisalsi]
MIIDTDVLIWNLRGDENAARFLDDHNGFSLSMVTYMELLQGLNNKQELRILRQAIHYWNAALLPITEGISHRAAFLVETYALSHNMQMADALIAATALQQGEPLVTANDRHYRHIDALDIDIFRPA